MADLTVLSKLSNSPRSKVATAALLPCAKSQYGYVAKNLTGENLTTRALDVFISQMQIKKHLACFNSQPVQMCYYTDFLYVKPNLCGLVYNYCVLSSQDARVQLFINNYSPQTKQDFYNNITKQEQTKELESVFVSYLTEVERNYIRDILAHPFIQMSPKEPAKI